MELFDTHCHIQEIFGADDASNDERSLAVRWHKAGRDDVGAVIADARAEGVVYMLCVGCSLDDSVLAVDLAERHDGMWASIGLHPHEASRYVNDARALQTFADLALHPKVKAVGECGLDYYYEHSSKADQEKILRFQMELALEHDLPMTFHVRDAFADFWPIFDEYKGLRGIVHSFTATTKELDEALSRGLYIALNGIMTFTHDAAQLAAAKVVPLERLVLETDAPFLTPKPFRGTICEPKHVRVTAEFLADLRGEPLILLAKKTTANARNMLSVETITYEEQSNAPHLA